MVRAGDLWINPQFVASMEMDQRHYANGPGDAVLIVRMQDGAVHRIRHQPGYLDGVDAYQVQAYIAAEQSCKGMLSEDHPLVEAAERVWNAWAGGELTDADMRALRDALGKESAP